VSANHWVLQVEASFRALANPTQAAPMSAYMKGIAPFLGIAKPPRAAAQKELGFPPVDDAIEACRLLYALPEREFHYVATGILRKYGPQLPPEALEEVKWFVQTHSWWDTVDELTKSVGGILRTHTSLEPKLDDWVRNSDFWVQRAAILHQLGFGVRTDVERLFRLCLVQASNKEFFVRKAIGWALRDYAWTDPNAVRTFVEAHRSDFSPLTVREALKNVDNPRAGNRKADATPKADALAN
jgi:3-methyladenine DNA glycosylase AlkD